MSFDHKWGERIYFCISSMRTVVLVNGAPIEFFPNLYELKARGSSFSLSFYASHGSP